MLMNSLKSKIRSLIQIKEFSVLCSLIIILGLFTALSTDFLSMESWASILAVSAEIGIVSLGVSILMIAGEFDLSVGANFALAGMIFAQLSASGTNSFVALGISLFAGSLIGLINGLTTIFFQIPSFITTLGTLLFWRGMVLLYTSGFPISAVNDNPIMKLLYFNFGNGLPSSFFWWIGLAAILSFYLKFSPFGNHIMATGGNEDIARSMGINTNKVKIICFVFCGLLAAFAGVIQFAHLNTLTPNAGDQYELRAIAIAVIGGTILTGGIGSIIGTVLGTILLSVINTGLVQAGVSTYWFRALIGLILIFAVAFNIRLQKFTSKNGY